VVYQQGRALEGVSLGSIAGKCPSVHGSEQITGLWTTDRGLWYEDSDRPVSVEVARTQGVSDLRFSWDANNQTDDGGGNRAIVEHWLPITRSSLHANVVLLARR
jgi:hypothetical protein